MDKHIKDS